MSVNLKINAETQKIFEIEHLAAQLMRVREEQKKIVLCHGVFDLLHVGHIRHFQRAKKFGDCLVVTITPDHYVNKGPHRPIFNEQLRAEVVASLDMVDFVAINKWPMAVETIKLLRPDFYVKGMEYSDRDKDRTGGIELEEDAIKSVGGELVFTDDIVFSSSSLINRRFDVFPREVSDYLMQFSKRFSSEDVIQVIEKMQALKILVVGEAIIDEYEYCEAIGKSSKEPMLAMKYLFTEKFAGGIMAVGNHVANFSDHVGMVTMLGEHESQEDFIRQKINPKICPIFITRENSPTIVKRRIIENYFFTKMIEVYRINDAALDSVNSERLCSVLENELPNYDVVVVVDFGHGMLTRKAIDILCSQSKFLSVSVQSNADNVGFQSILKYRRADYICITENEIRLESRDRRGNLRELIQNISNQIPCELIVVTRGKHGCICFSKREGFFEVPAFAGQVIDRMGAGDSFLSLTAGCAAQKAPAELIGFIGNVAGAQAVATIGHRASIQKAALCKHIEVLLK